MFKRIMVAADGSASAQHALKTAVAMASLFDAALCIVTVISDEECHETGQQLLRDATRSASSLSHVEARLLETDALFGWHGISEVIVAAVNDWSADLVVVGSGNRHGLERFISGAVEDEVVANVNTSVLVVHHPA